MNGGAWQFRDRLMALLQSQSDAYAANLQSHFLRHLQPFVATAAVHH